MLQDLTPILVVDAIEPQLPFYEGRLGFQRVMEVPHGDVLGFVGLARDGHMVMLQTRASLADDMRACAEHLASGGGALLYAAVDSLAEAAAALGDAPVIVPERETFYVMREVWVSDPAGNVIGLAERIAR